ncbi:DUF3379 domain-containing protein [Shewanella sp. 202IG2-18]|uniref:DUF3379 domain-containing protein n=1 Tax=Parashewanella hymeniacidonis TaxID=2807618 RepID=UPI00195F3965|nr:DUF3379 domain-containing protein [Parashewanella hymeniacidonis]MBM7073093.1 DUF3379 domain-containing protein [Parashewanella hymeniacidonis]
MDDLEFRRKVFSDPNSQEPDFLQAINDNAGRKDTLNSVKALNDRISDALNVDTPDGMAERLILRQQLKQHHIHKRKTGFTLAMAASVAFVAGIAFTLLRNAPVDLTEHAIAHVYHEDVAMSADQDIGFSDLNKQLVSLVSMKGAHFTQQPGEVHYSSYCDFQGVRSLHMVMQGQDGKVTVFIVPEEKRMQFEKSFSDKKYQGMTFKKDGAYMVLVGEDKADLNYVKKELEGTFI